MINLLSPIALVTRPARPVALKIPPSPRFQGEASLPVTPRDYRDYARNVLLNSAWGEEPFEFKTAMYMPYKAKETRKSIFDHFIAVDDTATQVAIAARIEFIPTEAERKDAYDKAWATKKTLVMAAAASQICYIPKADRKAAFDAAMATGDTHIQAAAAAQIWTFPTAAERKDASLAVLSTKKANVINVMLSNVKYLGNGPEPLSLLVAGLEHWHGREAWTALLDTVRKQVPLFSDKKA
jgi:hypothetical protein